MVSYHPNQATSNKLAGIGFILGLPPLLFVSAAVLKSWLGMGFLFDPLDTFFNPNPQALRVFNLVSPVVFLGGLLLALILNLYPILDVKIRTENEALVGTVTVKAKLYNVAVAGLSSFLLTTLLLYAFVENFTRR